MRARSVFHNVCSHRATKLLDRLSGNCGKRIVCPYHAWSYDLSGNLKHVAGLEDFENLDLKDHGLRIVEQEVLRFCFAKFSRAKSFGAPAVEPYLAEMSLTDLRT